VEFGKAKEGLHVVELSFLRADFPEPFFTAGHKAFIRLDGGNHPLEGTRLSAWIKNRSRKAAAASNPVHEPGLAGLVGRVQRIFAAHGVETTQLSRFLELTKAPFSVHFTDIQTDGAFLAWLDHRKIDWIARTFLIRREWIEGEDGRIHQEQTFDKQPKRFFSVVSEHADTLIYRDFHVSAEAYFVRMGLGKDWLGKGESRVIVIIAVPIASLSFERTVYKFICEFSPSPWEHGRTNIELRAWARLLSVNKHIACEGRAVSLKIKPSG